MGAFEQQRSAAQDAGFRLFGRWSSRPPPLGALGPNEVSRITRGLLDYTLLLAVLATLSPFDFDSARLHGWNFVFEQRDFVLNLLLLLPSGFLYALTRGGGLGAGCWTVFALGMAFSLCLELLQLALPSRTASPIDVVANGFGAWVGALVQQRLGRWLSHRLSEERVLELPLAGALYLLVPLVSIDAFAVESAERAWLVLPLGVFGAQVAASLYRHRFVRVRGLTPLRFASYTASVFGLAELPVLLRHRDAGLACVAATAVCTWLFARFGAPPAPAKQRFEAATIRRALPWFVLYLVGLAIYPWATATDLLPRWVADVAETQQLKPFYVLEAFAAFTLLGYLVSQVHARAPWPAHRLIGAICVAGLFVAGAFELVRGLTPWGVAPSALHALLLGTSTGLGAMLHRAQADLVRSLRISIGLSVPPPPIAPTASEG